MRQEDDVQATAAAAAPPLPPPAARPRFEGGVELGVVDANRLMSRRYCHVVGILGAPKAGKTAALVSLYLLVSRGRLRGYRFADSLSLLAFERLARGARRWNEGTLPEEVTTHTTTADERQPGFLHLRLRHQESRRPYDILLPDLPGEWTDALVDRSMNARLSFLKRSDAIWIFVDGTKLAAVQTRNHVLHRTTLLLDRFVELCGAPRVPVLLLVTRLDSGVAPPQAIEHLVSHAAGRGIRLHPIDIASFSDAADVEPGHGLHEAIRITVQEPSAPATQLSAAQSAPIDLVSGARQVLRYGLSRAQ